MACLLVPAAEAVVVSVVGKTINESNNEKLKENAFFKKRHWLTKMLWGGSILLAFEHIWHGEIIPWFPFLTAAQSSEAFAEMLMEMATVGVTMAILVSALWAIMVLVSENIENRVLDSEIV